MIKKFLTVLVLGLAVFAVSCGSKDVVTSDELDALETAVTADLRFADDSTTVASETAAKTAIVNAVKAQLAAIDSENDDGGKLSKYISDPTSTDVTITDFEAKKAGTYTVSVAIKAASDDYTLARDTLSLSMVVGTPEEVPPEEVTPEEVTAEDVAKKISLTFAAADYTDLLQTDLRFTLSTTTTLDTGGITLTSVFKSTATVANLIDAVVAEYNKIAAEVNMEDITADDVEIDANSVSQNKGTALDDNDFSSGDFVILNVTPTPLDASTHKTDGNNVAFKVEHI